MSNLGKKHSEDAKKKMSEKAKLRTGEKNSFFGRTHSDDAKEKMRKSKLVKPTRFWLNKKREDMSEENHPGWKGNEVGYHGLHSWVERKLGKPNVCNHCKDTKKRVYHWANISGLYQRKLNDWVRLCVSCHSKMDRKNLNSKYNKK